MPWRNSQFNLHIQGCVGTVLLSVMSDGDHGDGDNDDHFEDGGDAEG